MAKSTGTKWAVGIFLGAMFLLVLIRFFGPASWLAAARPNHWSCHQASFIFDEDEPVVILEMLSRGGYRSPDINAIKVLSLTTRDVVGSYYHEGNCSVLGITNNHVWIAAGAYRVGLNRNDLSVGVDLTELISAKPELSDLVESIKVDGEDGIFRISALDGHQYRLNSNNRELKKLPLDVAPPKPSLQTHGRHTFGGTIRLPSTIGEELLLEKEPLFDIHHKKLMTFSNNDYLLCYKTLKGPSGKLVIARISEEEQFVWKLTEADLFDAAYENGRTLLMSRLHDGTLYCVLQDFAGDESVYLAAVNVDSGDWIWTVEL